MVFDGYLAKTYYDYTLGESYTVGWEGGDLGPLDNDGYTPPTHWDNKSVFKFSRKVYDVVESVDSTDTKESTINQINFLSKAYDDVWKMNVPAYLTPMFMNQVQPENKAEEKDSPKQEKSLDNLLKELHNLKQEEKELSAKVDNILKEINNVMKEHGIAIVFVEDQ